MSKTSLKYSLESISKGYILLLAIKIDSKLYFNDVLDNLALYYVIRTEYRHVKVEAEAAE